MVRPAPQPPCAHPSSRRRPRPTSPSLITGCAIASGPRHTFPRAATTVTLAVLANAATTTAALATAALASAALATTAL